MTIFTTTSRSKKNKEDKGYTGIGLLAIPVWLLVWQLLAMAVDSKILLASPIDTVKEIWRMLFTIDLYKSILFTLSRVMAGFLSAVVLGIIFGIFSFKSKLFKFLLNPLVAVIRTAPVASFIILILIWIPSKNISIVISFLMAFPVIYTNVLEGLENVDKKLFEMAKVFTLPTRFLIRYIYIPGVIPYFRAACKMALGFAFKAGVAAEIIGLADGSIGENLYKAKIYLETPTLFAWTVIIILVSALFTKLTLWLVDLYLKHLKGVR